MDSKLQSSLKNKQKNKEEGEPERVIQPIEKEEKMAPKIAKCFTVVQVAENHPTVKMERTSGETRSGNSRVCVSEGGEKILSAGDDQKSKTHGSPLGRRTTEAFFPHLRSQTHIWTKAGIYTLPLFCCRF